MQNHITINKLEQEMKAQTLAKRTTIPHEETRLTMKHSRQKISAFLNQNQVQITRVSKCVAKISSKVSIQVTIYK